MQGLETPYETEVPIDFIDCSSCNKSIRSETLYKIHLTTIGHMKCCFCHHGSVNPFDHGAYAFDILDILCPPMKEEALVANGLAIRNHIVPDFEDIRQYLQYLNLDEPIIGLSHLEEVIGSDPNDPQPGPRYFCRLCSLEANLPNMINHIIGRKHRQKYLTTHRKDLVTWDHSTSFNQPAKVIRAKSEVIERQDGRGMPRQIRRDEGKSSVTRVLQRQRPKNIPQNTGQRDGPHAGPAHHPGHYPCDEGQPPPFHPDHYYLGPAEKGSGQRQNNHGRQEFMTSKYQRDCAEDPLGGRQYREDAFPQAEGHPTRDFREEMPNREEYQRGASPHRRPHPESDPLKEWYSEELRRERARANAAADTTDRRTYPSQEPQDSHRRNDAPRMQGYRPESASRHHLDSRPRGPAYPTEAPGRGFVNYSQESASFSEEIRPGASAPEESYQEEYRQRAGYPVDQDEDYSSGRLPAPDQGGHCGPEPRGNASQQLNRDYLFEMVGALRNRAAAAPYQTPPQGERGMSEIPEPFRRFLQGNSVSLDPRKRKSRFSDATQEELEGSKRMLMELDRSRVFEEPGSSWQRRERHEGHGSQKPEPYTNTQSQYQTEGYPEDNVANEKEGSKVFDLLKNIDIENGEEADFLKSRLCNLLKEFQAKKSEKALSRPDSAPISREYNHRSQAQRPLSPPHSEAGREAFREEMQWRPLENQPRAAESRPRAMEPHPQRMDSHPRNSLYPRGWEDKDQGGPSGERYLENRRPTHPDSNVSNRQRYEEVFGGVTHHRAPHAPHQEDPAEHRDCFQDPGDHYEYSPGAPEFMGARAGSPSYHREQGYQMPRGLQHTSSLDKITSTLLELVARK